MVHVFAALSGHKIRQEGLFWTIEVGVFMDSESRAFENALHGPSSARVDFVPASVPMRRQVAMPAQALAPWTLPAALAALMRALVALPADMPAPAIARASRDSHG